MANEEIIDLILETFADSLVYLLPIIGVMTGIVFIISLLLDVTINSHKKVRR